MVNIYGTLNFMKKRQSCFALITSILWLDLIKSKTGLGQIFRKEEKKRLHEPVSRLGLCFAAKTHGVAYLGGIGFAFSMSTFFF